MIRKKVCVIVLIMIGVFFLIGCTKIIRKTPIDYRFTPAHSETETYFIICPYSMIPMVRSVYKQDKFEILYQVEYEDGKIRNRWETVDRATYEQESNGEQNDKRRTD